MSVQAALQVALQMELEADADLMNEVDAVYSGFASADAAAPYLVIGERTENDDSDNTVEGSESTAAIHIWSDMQGEDELLSIYDHLKRILHRQPLTISGHTYVHGLLTLVTTMPDGDGDHTRMHGVARYRIRTEEA